MLLIILLEINFITVEKYFKKIYVFFNYLYHNVSISLILLGVISNSITSSSRLNVAINFLKNGSPNITTDYEKSLWNSILIAQ